MRTIRNRLRGGAAVALAVVASLLPASSVWADGHVQTSTFDPTPRHPDSGDECVITFEAVAPAPFGTPIVTPQHKADARRTRLAFEHALDRSPAFRKKVKDACKKHGRSLLVLIRRDSALVFNAKAQSVADDEVSVDPGDLEAWDDHLEGKPEDKEELLENVLIEVLAHEIDHLRDAPGDPHLDPAPGEGGTGPAVDDENAVLQDLGTGIQRNSYSSVDEGDPDDETDDAPVIEWTVDGQKVTLDLVGLAADVFGEQREEGEEPVESTVDPAALQQIPGGPCDQGVQPPCYPLAAEGDGDLDGAPDGVDNCPSVGNPQQADTDGDGAGHGCDPDDDGDGRDGDLELAAGSDDMKAGRVPEHWASPEACVDRKDNDRDGLVDSRDRSCTPPVPLTGEFPEPVAVGAVYPHHLRIDRGGVPEGLDLFPSAASLSLDFDFDGQPDGTLDLRGLAVLGRDRPGSPGGRRTMDLEVRFLLLEDTAAAPGSLAVGIQGDRRSTGQVVDGDPGIPGDYPANSTLDLFVELTGPGPDGVGGTGDDLRFRNQGALRLESELDGWPPRETTWQRAPGSPIPLFDDQGNRVADIVDAALSAESPATRHPRSLTLSLRRHLVAAGAVTVRDGFDECRRNVPVEVQRRRSGEWATVETARAGEDGRYSVRLRDRPGSYRAQAPGLVQGQERDQLCEVTTSEPVRHTH